MHFRTIIYPLGLTMTLVSGFIVPEVPYDGLWSMIQQADGTTILTSLDNLDLAPIITSDTANVNTPTLRRATDFAWPDGDCWPYELDHAGIDTSGNSLANWADSPGRDLCSGNSNTVKFFASRNAIVYYCIDAPNRCGNLDRNDVRYAMGQMDAHCRAYFASWFRWPGSVEIIGKARPGDEICV